LACRVVQRAGELDDVGFLASRSAKRRRVRADRVARIAVMLAADLAAMANHRSRLLIIGVRDEGDAGPS
jgi:hypothetical protein